MSRVFMAAMLVASAAAEVTVEGVTFTDAEASAAVQAANTASLESLQLTYHVQDAKIAQSIIDARVRRPIRDVASLANVAGVDSVILAGFLQEVKTECPKFPTDMSGSFARVTFTNDEAVTVVGAANAASFDSFLLVANLDATVATALFTARPMCSLGDVAVAARTQSALSELKSFVDGVCMSNGDCQTCGKRDCCKRCDAGKACGDSCISESDNCEVGSGCACEAEEYDFWQTVTCRCQGVPSDNIVPFGQCIPSAVYQTVFSCSADTDCESGLFCNWGSCTPEWMRGCFHPTEPRDTIPVPASGKVSEIVPVYGLATVPNDVNLFVNVSSDVNIYSIKIVGTDPNGASATYWDGPAEQTNTTPFPSMINLGGGISRDDEVNGAWKVTASNPGGLPATGSITNFYYCLTSRWD
ncbi:hypothetical protein DIPPA_19315 [Diplonema papillatum]|nr:hypothetical protein DIPPA_19315 [Diplonema papillatum]